MDIKDPYFMVISRQKQLFAPTWLAEEIAHHSIEIINSSWKKGAPIRMLTITGINLTDDISQEQLSLFDESPEKKEKTEKVELTMDEVRKKYGSRAIGFASAIKNDIL
ncbi:MAG: hypothetical protein IKT62_06625 [Firmicutes bacterium]|nr:hypothetical protein [Bacillota bacterium]